MNKYAQRFEEIEPPTKNVPVFPAKLSGLKSAELGDLQSLYAAWFEYTDDLFNRHLFDYMMEKEKYDVYFSRKCYEAEGKTLAEKERAALRSRDTTRRRNYLKQLEAVKEMIGRKLDTFDRLLQVISREVARRTNLPG